MGRRGRSVCRCICSPSNKYTRHVPKRLKFTEVGGTWLSFITIAGINCSLNSSAVTRWQNFCFLVIPTSPTIFSIKP